MSDVDADFEDLRVSFGQVSRSHRVVGAFDKNRCALEQAFVHACADYFFLSATETMHFANGSQVCDANSSQCYALREDRPHAFSHNLPSRSRSHETTYLRFFCALPRQQSHGQKSPKLGLGLFSVMWCAAEASRLISYLIVGEMLQ